MLRKACLGLLRMFGWTTSLTWPPERHGIILVYPHTSNWDFPIGVLFRIGHGLPAHWMGKDSMFRWPVRRLFLRIGGVPVNRRAAHGVVASLQQQFQQRDWLWLAVAPEGTRSATDHWKSGFYQLALTADLPIGLGYIDYGRRHIGIDAYIRMTGDEARDLETLRRFYADKQGRIPRNAGRIQFRAKRKDQA
jgi:1-acyl-sn-glycerol-3-phosphate acyltransferase